VQTETIAFFLGNIMEFSSAILIFGSSSRHIYMVLFFTHIPFVVKHTINATPPERLQQNV